MTSDRLFRLVDLHYTNKSTIMPDSINIDNLNKAKSDPSNAEHMGRRSGGEIAIDLAGAGLGALGGYALSRYVTPDADTVDRVMHTAAGGAAGLLAASLIVNNLKAPEGFDGSYREYMRARGLTNVTSTGHVDVDNAAEIREQRKKDNEGKLGMMIGGGIGLGRAIFSPKNSWGVALAKLFAGTPKKATGRHSAKQLGAGAGGFVLGTALQTGAGAAMGYATEIYGPKVIDAGVNYVFGSDNNKDTTQPIKYRQK